MMIELDIQTLLAFSLMAAFAAASNPHGWTPSVSTTNNLEEPDGNGFCIDISGFGSGLNCDNLQAHSCKPQGADTQFEFHAASGAIRAVNYAGDCTSPSTQDDRGCVTVDGDIVGGATLRLAVCDESAEQTFDFNVGSSLLTIGDGLCLSVDAELRQAGSFWARDLLLQDCATIDDPFMQWSVTTTSFCFPGNARVHVQNKGPSIPMESVKVGDMVMVDKGSFEPIYSLAHVDATSKAMYLHLSTTSGAQLDLTNNHMVFVERYKNSKIAVPASQVKVGDVLIAVDGSTSAVTHIDKVWRSGAYAPFTPSGTIVVNGIVASTFVAFQDEPWLKLGPFALSHQWLAHTFEFPHRLACHHFGRSCPDETHNDAGVATWVAAPLQVAECIFDQSDWLLCLVFLPLLLILMLVFQLAEIVVVHQWVGPVIACGGLATAYRTRSK